jgi:hypothetical protein
MVWTCNELNAGYAADGFARQRGVGCCVVTFCVGGFSALNAVAGAYAEDLPLLVSGLLGGWAGGQAGRRAGGQAGRRAGGQAGRRAGGQAGRRQAAAWCSAAGSRQRGSVGWRC